MLDFVYFTNIEIIMRPLFYERSFFSFFFYHPVILGFSVVTFLWVFWWIYLLYFMFLVPMERVVLFGWAINFAICNWCACNSLIDPLLVQVSLFSLYVLLCSLCCYKSYSKFFECFNMNPFLGPYFEGGGLLIECQNRPIREQGDRPCVVF